MERLNKTTATFNLNFRFESRDSHKRLPEYRVGVLIKHRDLRFGNLKAHSEYKLTSLI
jgi:hypothetical protein